MLLTTKENLEKVCWSIPRLAEAIEALARKQRISPETGEIPPPPSDADEAIGKWIEAVASGMGLEAEPTESAHAEIDQLIRGSAPALLRLPGDGEPRFLVLFERGYRKVSLLGPNLVVRRVQVDEIRSVLCREIEAPHLSEVDQMLIDAGVPSRRQARARTAILRERLRSTRVAGGWILRLPPGSNFIKQVRVARLPRHLSTLLCVHAVQYLLWILSWYMIGRGALGGRLDTGWLLAWALLLLTLIPFRLLALWVQGVFSIGVGALLKTRLLCGVLNLEPEEIRHQGAGEHLSRVIESEAVESLATTGGLLGLVAGIELIIAIVVLASGEGGLFHALLLIGWVACTALIGWRYFRERQRWALARLGITHDLVERMAGHRTRLAQESPNAWHDGEDATISRYLGISDAIDTMAKRLIALIPRGWMIIGLFGLAPAFIAANARPGAIAIGLGGILLAYRALRDLVIGVSHLSDAAIAWGQIAPLFAAASRSEVIGSPVLVTNHRSSDGPSEDTQQQKQTVIHAHDLTFRYRDEGQPVLRECTLRIDDGDRLLLEGPSGGGKSTLASLLVGLRAPDSGLLLLRGLDRQTLGTSGWRRSVVAAPQFHENHVLTETFAFNLLMGRGWPPNDKDFEECEAICRELGLGDLLDRMPAGMLQMVGETGWQLSHGEKSRLYIARALLQQADLVVLDESFAALDPDNLRRALRCVLNRAPALLVIAHP